MASKFAFKPEGARWWRGGWSEYREVRRYYRYITDGNGRKFESDGFTDDWYVHGDALDSDGKPYRYAVKGKKAAELTQFCSDNEPDRPIYKDKNDE